MDEKEIGVKQKSKFPWRWFGLGIASVVIIAGVFTGGLMVGNGSLNIGIGMQPVSSNKDLPNRLDYRSVNAVYDSLVKKFDGKLDEEKLLIGMKKGLVEAAGDPYTVYLDSEEAQSFNESLNGTFSGIGAELSKQDSNIIVVTPIAGSPAEKAGIKSKDIITAIDDQDATNISVEEAVKRIRGEAGTPVKLTVIRGGTEKLDFTITREQITIPSVETKTLDGNIGYIKISRFAEDTTGLVNKAVTDLKSQGVKGVILDMRNNPGGFLNTAVSVSSHWLKNGQTILEEKRDGKVIQSFGAKGDGEFVGMPTVVLVNEGSASASEITAGALKDNNVAQVVGVTSFGKGSVQEFSTFENGGVLKVTIARWFTPAGKNIDNQGIEPNYKVEITAEQAKAGQDPQLDKAQELLR
jgi:carboxyl-terminal processing protease